MKKISAVIIALVLSLAAHGAEEDQLLDVLKSGQSLREKDAACVRLKWIGTTRAVPALAELLTDDRLSPSARNALESMKGPEAEDALRAGLARTSGSNQVGIINSLGARGEAAAVPDVAKLLSSADPMVAVAAAKALGKMDCAEALQAAWERSDPGAVHDAATDGLLACANRSLSRGDHRQAARIFQEIDSREKEAGIRLAAYRGLILSSEEPGIAMMIEAIKGSDGPRQGAALQLASKLGGPSTTRALTGLLPQVAAPVQIALMQCLAQRGDRSAAAEVAQMLDKQDADVRLAAISALGDLGDGEVAVRLAQQAAGAGGAEQAAARQALIDLRHGSVTEVMLAALSTAPPEAQAELIRALGGRGDAAAAPRMLELAQGKDASTRSLALQGLALLAEPAQIPGMIELVVTAGGDDTRSEAADALGSACQHIQSHKGRVESKPLVEAARSGSLEARVALLGVCGGVSDPAIREALRAAESDPEARIRAAAVRALCDSQDEQLWPDIVKVACEAKEENFRALGIHGCVRMATEEDSTLSGDAKLDAFKAILDSPLGVAEKRLILSGLGSLPDQRALNLATPMLEDASVRTEAAQAVIHIAGSISAKRPEEAGAALKKVLAMSINPATRKSAEKAYEQIQ